MTPDSPVNAQGPLAAIVAAGCVSTGVLLGIGVLIGVNLPRQPAPASVPQPAPVVTVTATVTSSPTLLPDEEDAP